MCSFVFEPSMFRRMMYLSERPMASMYDSPTSVLNDDSPAKPKPPHQDLSLHPYDQPNTV